MLVQTKYKSTFRNEKGFSLIELLIAMTLGLILMSGVVQIFLSSRQAYSTVMGSSQTLDNGRLALYFLSTSIGKAGYWGEPTKTRAYGDDRTLTVNHSGTSNSPYSDTYVGRFVDNSFIFGLNNDNSNGNVIDGTDELFVRFHGNDANPMTTCAGDPVNASSMAVEHYYLSETNGSEALPSLVCETTILSIADIETGVLSVPASPEVKTQILIAGVENLQILFGEKNTSGSAVQFHTANNVSDWTLVDGVRVSLLAASPDQVNSVVRGSGFNLLDETTNAPTDKRARKVFESNIAMRNVNYL